MSERLRKIESFGNSDNEPVSERVSDDRYDEAIAKKQFRIVGGSDVGYGETVVRVDEGTAVESKLSDDSKESQFEIIPGTEEDQYGPSIRRRASTSGEVGKPDEPVNRNESVKEAGSLSDFMRGVVNRFELNDDQRKGLQATLLALGVSIFPAKEANEYLDRNSLDLNPVTTNWDAEPVSPVENVLVASRAQKAVEASTVPKESIKEEFNQIKKEIEDYQKKVEASERTPRNTVEVNKKSHEGKPLDAFEKEVVKHLEVLPEGDIDFMLEHAQKSVLGAGKFNRVDYVRNEIKFADWDENKKTGVPPVVEAELRKVLPGLSAQESKFHNGLVSASGAKGIMQFMPKTWESYGGKPEDFLSLKKQVEIAGEFFSDLHKQINHHVGEQGIDKLKSRFPSEAAFQRDLLVPLIINSYNVGGKGMSNAVQLYLDHTPVHKMPKGKELYAAISHYAKKHNSPGYGEEASEYVYKTYGWVDKLNERGLM